MKTIYLIRHAKSLPRDGMQYEEASTVALSSYGKWQARCVAKSLKKYGIQKVIASPLPRAKETAEILFESGTPIIFDDRLVETTPSRTLTGRAFTEEKKKTREDFQYQPKDGESFDTAATRFITALTQAISGEEKIIAIVSHALLMEAGIKKLFESSKIPTLHEAGVTTLVYYGNTFSLGRVDKINLIVRFTDSLRSRLSHK